MHTYNWRRNYSEAIDAILKAGFTADAAKCSQGYIRTEVIAATTTTQYNLGILVNTQSANQTQRATENRVTLQDAFYAAELQVLIGLGSSPTDTADTLYSFPNPDIFTTSGAALALNNFYNGYMRLTINNSVTVPQIDMLRFYKANQTQFVTGATSPVNQFDGGTDGAFPLEPNWVLIGSCNNILEIILPAAIGTLQASVTTFITVIMRGVLAQNVTAVKN